MPRTNGIGTTLVKATLRGWLGVKSLSPVARTKAS